MKIISYEEMSTRKSLLDSGFEKLMLEAIDEGLSLLGDCSKDVFYSHLDKAFNIKKQDIPNKIEEFTCAIERIFGNSAKLLEIEIMKHLYKKIEHDFEYPSEEKDLFFIEYVEAAQKSTNATEKMQSRNLLLKLT
jgi:hypothetical protein